MNPKIRQARVHAVNLAVAVAVVFSAASAAAQEPQSSSVAAQLTAAMAAQHVDAIAAKDPASPDRFVAALLIPDVQLLVIAGRYATPAVLQGMIDQKQYRDVYLALNGSSVPEGRVFIQDLKADGLRSGAGAVDIVYESVTKQTVFDGEWKKHGLSEDAYKTKFTDTDKQYAQMMTVLTGELKKASATHQ